MKRPAQPSKLYRSAVRLVKFIDLGAPEAIIDSECMLMLRFITLRIEPRLRKFAKEAFRRERKRVG